MSFEPGQRVRCVNNLDWLDDFGVRAGFGPRLGDIYTVETLIVFRDAANSLPIPFVALRGIASREGRVCVFIATAFEPLDEAEMRGLAAIADKPSRCMPRAPAIGRRGVGGPS